MFYFLQTGTTTKSDTPVENGFQKEERELDGDILTKSPLRADSYSVGEGVGLPFKSPGLSQPSY